MRAVTRPHTLLVSLSFILPFCLACFYCDLTDLVGSTLSDPYLSYAAALYALAGPLHGYAHPRSTQSRKQTSLTSDLQFGQPGSTPLADEHAEGDWREHHSRQHQRLPLEDPEERPSRPWVRITHFFFSDLRRRSYTSDSYGHGVLRNPDPRFIALQEFCTTRPDLLADPVIQLVKQVCIPLFDSMVVALTGDRTIDLRSCTWRLEGARQGAYHFSVAL